MRIHLVNSDFEIGFGSRVLAADFREFLWQEELNDVGRLGNPNIPAITVADRNAATVRNLKQLWDLELLKPLAGLEGHTAIGCNEKRFVVKGPYDQRCIRGSYRDTDSENDDVEQVSKAFGLTQTQAPESGWCGLLRHPDVAAPYWGTKPAELKSHAEYSPHFFHDIKQSVGFHGIHCYFESNMAYLYMTL